MNFNLTPPYEYESLKSWFRENWKQLPETLDTAHADFRDVKKAISVNIHCIDRQLELHGKPNEVMRSYKRILVTLYEGLQIKENWNLPLEKVADK